MGTLLLIEASASLAALIQEVLGTELGYTILQMETCDDALTLLQHGLRPELILLDLNRTRAGGFDFCDQLQADVQTAQIPLVVLTTNPYDPQLTQRPITAILPKPFDLDALIQTVVIVAQSTE